MFVYAFEKLEVWQDARKLAVLLYKVAGKFPVEEKFGVVSQIRRAAIAVASNIAEGSGRKTIKDQSHFYHIAYSSALEVLNQLIISHDLGFISTGDFTECRMFIEKVTNKINALKNSLDRSKISTSQQKTPQQ
ncbi:MAG: four helix bundle protein [Flavisolibacter sp.]